MNPSILTRRSAAIRLGGGALAVALLPAQEPSATGSGFEKLVSIQCGGLDFQFDPRLGFVRHIRWNGIEVLNGIYAAVRDEVWGTVTPQVSNVIVETEAEAFKIVFEVNCQQGPIHFLWNGTITGAPRALTFEMEGEAKTTFKRNRIGFCVLHPLKECAGKPCKIDREGRVSVDGTFPDLISPHQPFVDMRGIRHEVYPGLMAEVRFTGDTFEMEDHRNWTDGNFKTYCTPLSKPFPVEVPQGTKITQSVSLRLAGTPKPLPQPWRKPAFVRVDPVEGGSPRKLPALGFGLAMDGSALTVKEGAKFRAVGAAHLRGDVTASNAAAVFDRAMADLRYCAPGAGLEAAVFLSGSSASDVTRELSAFAGEASKRPGLKIARWIVFHVADVVTGKQWIDLARQHLKGAPVGGGTNQYFTELNRNRPDPDTRIDFAAYSINPQVHAFDNLSLMENLAPQADTIRTARSFLGPSKGIAITPVTLRPRFNPQAKIQPAILTGELPARVDPRQSSLFAAAWTAGSLQYLSGAGADSVTYFETHGWAGLLERDSGSPLPAEKFASKPGAVFPLFHVFAAVAGFKESMPVKVSDPGAVSALWLRSRLVLANLTDVAQRVRLSAMPFSNGIRVRMLDAETLAGADTAAFWQGATADLEMKGSRLEFSLAPYAVAVVAAVPVR
jgi:D-apionolactonase